jgi:hypothetical protein
MPTAQNKRILRAKIAVAIQDQTCGIASRLQPRQLSPAELKGNAESSFYSKPPCSRWLFICFLEQPRGPICDLFKFSHPGPVIN